MNTYHFTNTQATSITIKVHAANEELAWARFRNLLSAHGSWLHLDISADWDVSVK